jgi:hypothetical protein
MFVTHSLFLVTTCILICIFMHKTYRDDFVYTLVCVMSNIKTESL